MPTHTDADRRRPTSGSGSPRPTTRRTQPAAVLPHNGPPPRARIRHARHRQPRPHGVGGGHSHNSASRGNAAAGEAGTTRQPAQSPRAHGTHHTQHTAASREQPRSWTRAGGTHVTEGTGEERETAGTREPTVAFPHPTPRQPSRGKEEGAPRTRGPFPNHHTTETTQQLRNNGGTTDRLCPA